MGLNKADVDAVVHFNMPRSLEHYVQVVCVRVCCADTCVAYRRRDERDVTAVSPCVTHSSSRQTTLDCTGDAMCAFVLVCV
jgi:superfamily II DNA helicase RecQ